MNETVDRVELAYYYPNQFWDNGDWVKSLVLIFDGVALLVPTYMKDRFERWDPAITVGLRDEGLLHIIEPETAVDQTAAEALATTLTDIITSGALDKLAHDQSSFQELSMSRLGYDGDRDLAKMIHDELKNRGLASDSKDGASIPMHPMVRSLVLTLLSQILSSREPIPGAHLSPVTDREALVSALDELLNLDGSPSKGNVVAFDFATMGIDVGPVPLTDIVAFKKEHRTLHQQYVRSARLFMAELSQMDSEERTLAFEERQAALDEMAAEIRKATRKTWRKACTVGISLTGAAWKLAAHDPIGAALAASGAIAGFEKQKAKEVQAFSYLFRARDRFY